MSKKTTVLLVGPTHPTVGGITTFISDLLNSDLSTKFDFSAFSTNRPENTDKIPRVHNFSTIFRVSTKYLFKSIFSTISNMVQFILVITRNKIDIVHINSPSYWSFLENSYYVKISKIFKKKVILHIHGGAFDSFYLDSSYFMKKYIKYIMNSSDRVISLSHYWRKFFVDQIGINSGSVVVIHNGVVASKYNSLFPKTKRSDMLKILFIGGTDFKRKGAYDIINAIPLVLNCFNEIEFIFIGKGGIDRIEEMCKKLDIDKNVIFLGPVSEEKKIEMLKSSDIFLLPSYAEGLPISILEAMATGLPVISTTVGAIPEIVKDDVNGYLIEAGNYKSLAEKLLVLLKNDKKRYEMGENNRKMIMKNYDIHVITNSIDQLYGNLKCN